MKRNAFLKQEIHFSYGNTDLFMGLPREYVIAHIPHSLSKKEDEIIIVIVGKPEVIHQRPG